MQRKKIDLLRDLFLIFSLSAIRWWSPVPTMYLKYMKLASNNYDEWENFSSSCLLWELNHIFYMDLFSDVAQVLGTDSTKEKNSECFYLV